METTNIVVLVTTSNREEAEKIVKCLLDEKLIACANIISSVSSFFTWKGKTEKAKEHFIIMKSRLDLFEKISEKVKAIHSYQVPEIIALPIIEGFKAYLKWLNNSLR